MATFGEYLLRELQDRDWSQSKLASRAGVSRAAISDVITGRRNPGVDLCNAIASALNVPPVFVFRAAGLLPYASEQIVQEEFIRFKLDELTQAQINEVLEFIEFIQQRDKKKPYYPPPAGLYGKPE